MNIVFKNVNFSYNKGRNDEKLVLKDINLNLQKGLVHGIIGPIGSGKSTLIELMNGLTKPDSGFISIGNYELHKSGFKFHKFRYDVGLVFQFPEKQFICNTVAEEVAFSSKIFEPRNKNIKTKVIKALKMVGLDESYLKRNPLNLNGGEKRRIAIASVLMSNPKLIIMDEPTIGLDDKSKKKLIKLLRALKTNFSKTVVIVTHDVDMLYEIADNIIILNKGKVIKEGNRVTAFSDTKLLEENNTPIPNIIKIEKYIYDKYEIDLGYCPDINSLVKKIAEMEGDLDE